MSVIRSKMNHAVGICAIVALVSVIFCSCRVPFSRDAEREYRNLQTNATNSEIAKSPDLQRLEAVCTSIRLPDTFQFVSKGGIDDRKLSLAYHYESESSFQDTKLLIVRDLKEKGWDIHDSVEKYPPEVEFFKDGYHIVLTYHSPYSLSNYGIYCEKLSE